MHTGFCSGHLMERNHLEDLGVDGANIKINLQEVRWGGMDWTDLAQDRYRWREHLNAVVNLRGVQNVGIFLTS